MTCLLDRLRDRIVARDPASPLINPDGPEAALAIEELRARVEAAWRDGWLECKNCLTDDEAFYLTEDVEQDAWSDSETRKLTPRAEGDSPGVRDRV